VKLPVVTNTQVKTFRRCQREHHYAYRLGYRAVDSVEALRFGTLVHCGFESYWLRVSLEDTLALITSKAADEYEAAKARALIIGYFARWREVDDAGPLPVAVEAEFRAPLRNPETGAPSRTYQRGGKLDVLFADHYMEHKTTSEEIGVGSVYWKRLTLDAQISTYFEGASALGVDAQRCVYDVVRKPGLRPSQVPILDEHGCKIVLNANGERVRTAKGRFRETASAADGYVLQTRTETPEEYESRIIADIAENVNRYYQRGDVVRFESELEEAEFDVWHLTRSMRESELAGRYPRNPDACERYGRTCVYFDVCCGTASLDDASRFERVENVHQELSQVA